jgi:hypothetical protein
MTISAALPIYSTTSSARASRVSGISRPSAFAVFRLMRGFIKLNLISLAMTAGAILVLLVALGAIVVLPLVLSFLGLGGWGETLLSLMRWPLLLCFSDFWSRRSLPIWTEQRVASLGVVDRWQRTGTHLFEQI